jgi:hypothetical protein
MPTKHYEESACIPATAQPVFDFVDDPARLSSHMSRSSWMMGGGNMATVADEGGGQAVGSHIRLSGKAFGFSLFVDEVVTQREPPRLKVWETVGSPRLLVMGAYRITILVEPQVGSSTLRIAIDYHLPQASPWLGRLFGRTYARWCVSRMLNDAQARFS